VHKKLFSLEQGSTRVIISGLCLGLLSY